MLGAEEDNGMRSKLCSTIYDNINIIMLASLVYNFYKILVETGL